MDWVFLRGLSREQRHWGGFPEVFQQAVAEARVHCLDLPGTGTEAHRASPATIPGIVEDLRARFLALRASCEGPFALLGMSLGGMVAMQWCADHPEDFVRVCLVNTSAGDLNPPWDRIEPRALWNAVQALATRDPLARERLVLSMVTRCRDDVAAIAEDWARIAQDRPVRRATVVRQLAAASRFRSPERLPIPALVLAGARDLLASPSCARALAERFGAPLEVHPEAGHELSLDAPEWFADQVAAWVRGATPRAEVRIGAIGSGPMPLVIEPGADRSAAAIEQWITRHRAFVDDKLTQHGALLLRGFAVDDAPSFERVARAVSADLKNDYLGTSPRNGLTDYVFSASELPPYYPIPQHCEMSFTRSPPRRLFFCCLVPSTGTGGETPIVDFRKVARDLDPEVLARFVQRGVMNIRNYAGPEGGSRFDPWKLKRWDEMFRTTEREAVEARCRENGFDFTWKDGGQLRLTNVQPALKPHPVTGEAVWFNHAQVFHLSAAPAEYRRIARRLGHLPYDLLGAFASAAVGFKSRAVDALDQAMHCTFGDGSPIPDSDMDRVRDAIWKNMVFFKWQRGDVLVIDNDSVAHGRMPYRGPRTVAVCWA